MLCTTVFLRTIIWGDYSNALRDAENIVKMNPESEENWNLKGNVHALFGQYREATAAYTKAIELNRDYAEAYYNRGLLHVMNYNPSLGCSDLQRSRSLGFPKSKKVMASFCE